MINYSDLGLSVNKTRSSFKFQDLEIEISNYLPIRDKYDLVMTTIQKSKEGLYYNVIKLNMFFKLHLIYMYTDIVFSQSDYADEAKVYDELVCSGFMDAFLKAFPTEEYNTLLTLVQDVASDVAATERSAGAVVQSLIQDLPGNASKAVETLKEINPDSFKSLLEAANAMKGGKPLVE
jgi:hypothetical protein